jgi:hypothetical protein
MGQKGGDHIVFRRSNKRADTNSLVSDLTPRELELDVLAPSPSPGPPLYSVAGEQGMSIAKALNVNGFKLLRTMVTTPKAKDTPALRHSASLVLVNSSNEILLVHRNPITTSFAGMHVRGLSSFSPSLSGHCSCPTIRLTFG